MPLDSIAVFSVLDRVTNSDGTPVSEGTVEFYLAGTSTLLTVYSDYGLTTSLGTTVSLNSAGYPVSGGGSVVSVYTGTSAYKIIVKDADGATIPDLSRDNIKGAVEIPVTDELALPETPVVTKTSAYSIVDADQGKVINANCTGGSFVLTLPSAVTVGDGWRVAGRHVGTANVATIRTTSSQTIDIAGKQVTSFALKGRGQSIWLVSDGANWHVDGSTPAFMQDGLPYFKVTDRLTAPPTSPTGGARYIANGTPTGAWSTLSFSENQIIEADGNGSWFAYTPDDGYLAYVEDEALYSYWNGSAWTDMTNVTAPTTSVLKTAKYELQYSNGTGGGTPTTGSFQNDAVTAWTEVSNTTSRVTYDPSGAWIFTAGTFLVIYERSFYNCNNTQIRWKSTTTSTAITSSTGYLNNGGLTSASILAIGVLTLASTESFQPQYLAAFAAANGLGLANGSSSDVERYGSISIVDLTSIQGPQGEQGTQGTDGLDAAYPYQWSTSTSGDPGSGKIRGNNATIASITEIAVSETDSAGGTMSGVIDTWDSGTSSVKARIKISKEGATQNFHYFYVTGTGTDAGSYWTFPVSYTATSGTIANNDNCAVLVLEKGDKGDTGTTGAQGDPGTPGTTGATGPNTGLDYAFNTATSGDPGSGKVLFNNATLSSVSQINISETGRNSEALAALIATWDDSTNTAHYGHLRIFAVSDRTKFLECEITGTITDAGSYRTIPVTYTAGGTLPANNDVLAVMFERTGNKGADGAGSFTSLSPGAGTTSDTTAAAPGSAITTTGTLSAAELVNAQTGTTYTVLNTDRAKLVTLSNASSIAVTLPQAGASSEFQSGWFADFFAKGAGTVTITPTTSTINGAASLTIPSGQGCRIASDGSNYQVSTKPLIVGTDYQTPVTAAVLAALAYGPFTTIASATTTNLSTVATVGASITGTTTITSFGTGANLLRIGKFTGALTLTYNATTLILPTGGNITTAAGDTFIALSDGSGNWTVVSYVRANGYPLVFDWGTSQAVKAGTYDVGNASDTTIGRAEAGVIKVEDVPLYSQIPQNSQSAAYTLVLADAQKHIYHPGSDNNARTFTIPANSSVAYPIGTCLTFVNAINTVTISITTDTMTLAGAGTTGSRTLAANGIATAMKVASTSWIISGVGLT